MFTARYSGGLLAATLGKKGSIVDSFLTWKVLLALGVAVVLLAIAAIHIYWAVGGWWPGSDEESLVQTVMGGPPGTPMPGSAACLGVAAVFLAAALLVLHLGGVAKLPVLPLIARPAAGVLGGILALRGAFGFFEERLRPSVGGSRYARLNVCFYSPLCLVLAALVLLLL